MKPPTFYAGEKHARVHPVREGMDSKWEQLGAGFPQTATRGAVALTDALFRLTRRAGVADGTGRELTEPQTGATLVLVLPSTSSPFRA